jgi:hypothetical protein
MYVRSFCLHFLFETFSAPINTYLSRYARDVLKKARNLHVNRPLLLSDFVESWKISTILVKLPNYKFHENPFSDSRAVTCGQETWRS